MVGIYAAPTFVDVELLEAAFRAHKLPYVIRYKVRYMEPTFAGDELRMSRLLVHRSRVAEAEALLVSLGLGENDSDDEDPTPREHFEALLDGVGTAEAKSLELLWSVGPEAFGDWMVASLPDLLDRVSVDAVLAILAPLDDPTHKERRASLMFALADAPPTTRTVVMDALEGARAPERPALWAELLEASAAG